MATVSRPKPSERYRFIEEYGRRLGIKKLCEWFGVSRSGYYDWKQRPRSNRSLEDDRLKQHIRTIYDDNKERYGSPRIHKALQSMGFEVARKRIARLMREMNLVARVVKVTRRAPGLKRFIAAGRNRRLNQPAPTSINQVWTADITYLKVKNKWVYLSVIMDLYSRRIVGWSLDKNRTTATTARTLRNSLKKRDVADGLIFHTDRGIEYRGFHFQKCLKESGMLHSLNRLGHCTDNAHMESFFHSLKAELIRGMRYSSINELRQSLMGYINHYYNNKRLHSGIDYQSPVAYEQLAA